MLVWWGVNIILAFDLLASPPSARYYIPLPSTSRHDRVVLRAFFSSLTAGTSNLILHIYLVYLRSPLG